MGIYLKKFENHTLYDSYINGDDAILPNVSICTTEEDVHYNSYVLETMVVAKYNVTSTSEPTVLRANFEENIFKSMEIDGVMLDELVTEYTFDTTGDHIVKYELYDETKLGNNAPMFYNNNLVEIIIPNSVTNIGTNAFNSCSGLTSIDIPDNVTSIGTGAFASCSNLTSCTIGNSVTSIGPEAFKGCSSLTNIDIPDSVTNIGNSTFIGTDALKVLNYNAKCELSSSFRGGWSNLETVIIGDSTPSIGSNFFQGSNKLTSVIIGNGVTSIGTESFSDCSSLTNVTIGNCVTSINQSAFKGCSSLTSITIPDSVTSIDYTVFQDCDCLTSIISNAMTAPTISNYTFKDIKTGGTLTVPTGSTGYDVWMGTDDYYLGSYNWTKVEQ